jgi:DNA repair exonuclease SbcCD nuclease subunit
LFCFSDIHHAAIYPGGIVEQDVLDVELRFNQLAIENAADACIFAGDRFLKHSPEDFVRVLADGAQKARNDSGKVTFSLVGNHDWWGKGAATGHSNRISQEVWQEYLPNLVIMDEVRTYTHPSLPQLFVHALPACIEPDPTLYDFTGDGYHVLVFHGMVKGCLLDSGGYRSSTGIPVEKLDDPRFNVAIGGDIHIPQPLAFKHTKGGYVGSCIQQSRRDRGDDRGFLVIDLAQGQAPLFTFQDSLCPRYVDIEWKAEHGWPTNEQLINAIMQQGEDPLRAIVTLLITGTSYALAGLGHRPNYTGIRHLAATRRQPEAIAPLVKDSQGPVQPTASNPLAAFTQYLERPGANHNNLDPARLLARAAKILE